MRRFIPLMLALAIVSPAVSRAGAEQAPSAQELHELREAVEQQAKQIEILTEQVGKLTRLIEGQKAAEHSVKTVDPGSSAPTTVVDPAKPPTEGTPEAAKADAVPKTEAVAGGTKHVVAKGETLTSIAKHYNIAITDLKNANKIEDERKLQIGQILSVPTPKPADTSDKNKKENP